MVFCYSNLNRLFSPEQFICSQALGVTCCLEKFAKWKKNHLKDSATLFCVFLRLFGDHGCLCLPF